MLKWAQMRIFCYKSEVWLCKTRSHISKVEIGCFVNKNHQNLKNAIRKVIWWQSDNVWVYLNQFLTSITLKISICLIETRKMEMESSLDCGASAIPVVFTVWSPEPLGIVEIPSGFTILWSFTHVSFFHSLLFSVARKHLRQ